MSEASGGEDWRGVGVGASAWFDAPSLTAGAALVGRIAELAGGTGLPDVDLRPSGVRVRIGASGAADLNDADLTDADLGEADVALARAISRAARELGLAADPSALQTVQLAIDAADTPSVMSFWRTTLAYEPVGDDALVDPLRRDPAFSFHPLDQPRPLRNRIHVDVSRAPNAVDAVKATVGQEAYGAYQLTLADAEGNEVDLVPGGELSKETADWRTMFGAMTFYPTAPPSQASELATTVAGLADDAGLPMLVDLRPDGVTIDSGKDEWEDDEGAAESRFVDLASRIQTAAREMGLAADPTRLRFVQLGIDALDVPAVRAFWTTVLGYQHDRRPFLADIHDPRRLNPVIIFQQLDPADEERRRQRNRIRFDISVPYDQLEARINAALAAGGRIVTDETPGEQRDQHHELKRGRRCTLTDPEGNELDLVSSPASGHI
ncbi:hypothetical protein OG394_06370 [Kribbella sp. NBC_01245]|uniref:VOC family protein n=1 Tax=Kribbella sp. NBC_01245 TaxID=2903578 RepID=UPI002E297FA9|nr:VOC family protein [Kribbella sp. NBC_01245]